MRRRLRAVKQQVEKRVSFCRRWLIVQSAACLLGMALSEVLGISRRTVLSLSALSFELCASTFLLLGLVPALCAYFGRRQGQEPTAFRLRRERPLAWIFVGITTAILIGGATFGAGLYFAGLGAERSPTSIECVPGRMIQVREQSFRKLGHCSRWARVALDAGEIIRPCLNSAQWPTDLPNSGAIRDDDVFVLINRNWLGTSLNKVLSIREGAQVSICSSKSQSH